jgi:hypothetical protein
VLRVLSLVYLLTRPSGLALYLAYLVPIQVWAVSNYSFMGFLGLLYF